MQQIITFLTDMGTKDPYLASLNLNYFNHFPALKILHLSHDIESYDRLQAAYYLRYLYADFPKNTIHVVNVGNANRYLYTEFLDSYIIAPDNGIIPLITDQTAYVYEIPMTEQDMIFPAIGLISHLPYLLEKEQNPNYFLPTNTIKILQYPKITRTDHVLIGEVLHIDHYDNLITNIHYYDFQYFKLKNNFIIHIKTLFTIHKISTHYNSVSEGEIVAIFNQKGFLEIAFHGGSKQKYGGASNLMGIIRGDKIKITFLD